jgi:hypothetical protein
MTLTFLESLALRIFIVAIAVVIVTSLIMAVGVICSAVQWISEEKQSTPSSANSTEDNSRES